MKNKLITWLADKQGVTGIEYCFLIGIVGGAVISGGMYFSEEFNAMQNIISGYVGNSTKLG